MTMSATLYQRQSSEIVPDLVRSAQAGDLQAFELLVQRMQSLAYHWAYTLLQHAQLAEDAVQEAFIEAYLNLAQLREPAAFPGWLRRIILKHCDRLTRHKQLPTVSLEPLFSLAIDDLNPSLIIEDQERHFLLDQALAALPEHEHNTTLLFYNSDLSLKEIATTLGLPLSTIKKRLFDARKHLKGTLIASCPEIYQLASATEERPLSQQVPLYDLSTSSAGPARADQFVESGIKVVDLLVPLARGSVVAVVANFGVGSMVLVEELLYNLIHRQHGCAICLGLEENEYTASEFFQMVKELDAQNQVTLLFESTSASSDLGLRLLSAGLTLAQEFRKQGREVSLVLNRQLVTLIKAFDLTQLQVFARTEGVSTFLFSAADAQFYQQETQIRAHLDGCFLFNTELALQRIYPAVDTQLSNSHLLESSSVSQEHKRVAAAARDLLREGQRLRVSSSLTPEQEKLLARSRKLQLFLSQPFFVAELFTEVPGEFMPLTETLKDVQALLAGQYDALPEKAFAFIGGAAHARARAAQL